MNGMGLVEHLRAIVGDGFVLEGENISSYLEDWRGRYHGSALCAVRPADKEEVAAVVAAVHAAGLTIVPQGGNTGLCGAATPDSQGQSVVLLLDRLNAILEINVLDSCIRVQAGCVLQTVQEKAEEAGFYFPLSLGAEGTCQIGGNIATNAGGTAVLKYGSMRSLVLGLSVVLPDGGVCDWSLPLRKNSAGYDLKQLFIGSEGTLGIITEATLRIFPKPLQVVTVMAAVETVDDALALFVRLTQVLGERIRAFEIMNRTQMDLVLERVPGNRLPFAEACPYYVLVEVTETLPRIDLSAIMLEILEEQIEAGRILDAVVPYSLAQAEDLWRLRHSVSEANKLSGISVAHDTAVPVSQQGEFIRQAEEGIRTLFPELQIPMVGHIGDGNIHVVVIVPYDSVKDEDERTDRIARIHAVVDDVVIRIGGTISAEHGIGQSNKLRLQKSLGETTIGLMRSIKRAIDPDLTMNPGKVIDMR